MRRYFVLLGFITLSFISGYHRYRSAPGHWYILNAKNGTAFIPGSDAGCIAIGTKLYLIGGRALNPVNIFDTETQTWSEGATPPVELHHFQPVNFQGLIYIIGAFTGNYPDEKPVPVIYTYNPDLDRWAIGDSIPAARRRGSAGAVTYNEQIYLVSGIRNGHIGDHKPWLDCYNPADGSWTVLPDAPQARDHFKAVAVQDTLYLIGGQRSMAEEEATQNAIREVDAFNLKMLTWNTIDVPFPTPRADCAALVFGDEILIIGGESKSQSKAHSEVEAFSTTSQRWRSFPRMRRGRHGMCAASIDGNIYVPGGCGNRGGYPELESMEVFYPDSESGK